MAFLEDLLTFERKLTEGAEVVVLPRKLSLRGLFSRKDTQPSCYKKHQTKAGLPVVLLHDCKGRLFLSPDEGVFSRSKSWNNQVPLAKGFYLQETCECRTESRPRIFGSKISKSFHHAETNDAIDVSVGYVVAQEGIPTAVRISYGIKLEEHPNFKTVVFEAYRLAGDVVAAGPLVCGSQKNFKLPEGCGVNHEETLEYLVSFIRQEKLSPVEFKFLFHLSYVRPRMLH